MSKHALPVLAAFFFVTASVLYFVMRPLMAGQVERYRSVPVLEVSEVKALAPGSDFRMSATVAESNRALYRDMVAYEIEEWREGTGSSSGRWRTTGSEKPPLALRDANGHTVSLEGDYLFNTVSRVYELSSRRRYRGLVAGDSVGVYGTAAEGTEGVRVLGDTLTQGDAESLITGQEEGIRITEWVVAGEVVAGVLCLGVHVWRRRRSAESLPR
jgi:hypothetical protein